MINTILIAAGLLAVVGGIPALIVGEMVRRDVIREGTPMPWKKWWLGRD